MKEPVARNKSQLLTDILDGLTQANGGASQLMHSLRDPRWMMLREQIDRTKTVIGTYAENDAVKSIMVAGAVAKAGL